MEADGELAEGIGVNLKDDVYRKTAEIGYFIGEEYWGKGIATEAIGQMVHYVHKNFDVLRIYAEVFEYNKAFMRALGKKWILFENAFVKKQPSTTEA